MTNNMPAQTALQLPVVVLKALSFAAHCHQYQRRGGYSRLPYVNHLIKVVEELVVIGRETDADLLCAAALHDAVEDGHTNAQEMEEMFGPTTASIVLEVSDDMTLPEFERKNQQVTKAASLTNAAKKLKIADKVCNIRDIIEYPIEWDAAKKLQYVHWATDVVYHCRGVNPALDDAFDLAAARAKRFLENGGLA